MRSLSYLSAVVGIAVAIFVVVTRIQGIHHVEIPTLGTMHIRTFVSAMNTFLLFAILTFIYSLKR